MKKFLKVVGIVLASLVAVVLLFVAVASIAEYRPADVETVALAGNADGVLESGQTLTIVSWNLGYGGLSETADFFMDGGTGVHTQDRAQVNTNLQAFIDRIAEENPDVIYLQEVDVGSTRSWYINEAEQIGNAYPNYQNGFANNFKVLYMPFPMPPYGHIDSGIMTLSRFAASEATRVQLPCPFSWPVRTLNLKRCLLVERIPIVGSDKELVLINLHLEAYDSGEGKVAQTKMLVDLMQAEREKGNYVIAGGDFNQSFSSVDTSMYPLQGEGLWECGEIDTTAFPSNWQFCMDTTYPTCRSLDRPLVRSDETFQYYVIDGFIVSDNLIVESMETFNEGFANTDHNPIKIVITLIPE